MFLLNNICWCDVQQPQQTGDLRLRVISGVILEQMAVIHHAFLFLLLVLGHLKQIVTLFLLDQKFLI